MVNDSSQWFIDWMVTKIIDHLEIEHYPESLLVGYSPGDITRVVSAVQDRYQCSILGNTLIVRKQTTY